MIKKWIRKIARQVLNEEREGLIDATIQVAESLIPSASDVAQEIDTSELADYVDVSDVAYSMDESDVAQYIEVDTSELEIDYDEFASYIDAQEIAKYIEVDAGDIEVDYDELARHAVDHIDLEEFAHHADVDRTIFSHIHMLQTRIDALIEVVRGSAQNTIDLMTFNKALEGEEE